jgi:hypothetical protein
MATIKITTESGNLRVEKNLVTLSIGSKDTVTWDVDVEDGFCVEIVFCAHCGVMGPFQHREAPTNPARGRYKTHLTGGVDSNDIDTRAAVPGSIWKYDVVLFDKDTGQEIFRKDPYVKIIG